MDQISAIKSAHLPDHKEHGSKPQNFFEASSPSLKQQGGTSPVKIQGREAAEDSDVPPRAETPVIQVNSLTQSFVQSFLTVDFKSTLQNHLGVIPPKEVSYPASWKAGSLSTKLEGNPGLLDPKYRLPNRLPHQTMPTCNTTLSPLLCRADASDLRGNHRVTSDGTCKTNRIFSTSFSFPRRMESNTQ